MYKVDGFEMFKRENSPIELRIRQFECFIKMR